MSPMPQQPVRMLHIVGDSKFGGGSVIIQSLAEDAHARGWQVDVLTTDPEFIAKLHAAGLGVVELDVIHRDISLGWDLLGLWRLYRYLKTHKYDLVHTHTSKAGFVGRIAARLAGVPAIVHTVHGFAFHEESSQRAIFVYGLCERFAACCCDRLITVSQYHRDWAIRLHICDAQRVVAIPNGMNANRVSPSTDRTSVRTSWGISNDECVILAMGRLAPQKGLEYLLRAIPMIAREATVPFRVILVGEGPLRVSLESMVEELDLRDRVLFLGFQADVGNVIAAADIIAIPSLWEGLSIALLEAMLAGKPIVASNIGSNREVAEESQSALLVPPKDVEQLAQALIALLKDQPLRARLAATAQRVVHEEYSESRMLDSYWREYQRVLAK